MRKTQQAIAALCLISPASAFALGVGDITTYSALNQTLNAKIPLVSTKDEDPSNIRISLASRESFKNAGLDRPQYLSDLKFTPVVDKNGGISINVTSSSSIKEPFVNFLLEVDWPQGRTLKEFTILLDPPITMSDVTTSPVELAKSSTIEPIAPKVTANSTVESNVTKKQSSPSESYGPTQNNDTIWGIAKKLKNQHGSAVTHEQMMMALFENNPKAFYKKNINALMKGQILQVPSTNVINQLSPQQARNAFKDQNTLWSSSAKAPSSSNNSVKNNVQNDLDTNENAKLKLLTPKKNTSIDTPSMEAVDSTSENKSPDAINNANMAIEMVTTLEQENKDVKSRLSNLEAQIEKLQRLVTLKDEQLSQLQSTTKEAVVTPKIAPKKLAPPVVNAPVEEAEENNMALYAGGGLIIALLGLYLARRRKGDEDQPFPAAENSAYNETEFKEEEQEPEEPIMPENDTISDTLLSEFTPSEFDNLDLNQEADPLTECDVYIAYGRYQQAEDLIQTAISEDPSNLAYKLKLLDVYFSSENASSFENLAKELSDLKESDSDTWDGISNMGNEICPESPLFVTPLIDNVDTESAESITNDTFEQLDDIIEDEAAEETSSELPELDFDITAEDTQTTETVSDETPKEDEENEFEFDFDLVKPDLETNETDDTSSVEADIESGEQEESSESNENIADTKLSLAEAYIEMLDKESAKEALEEVLEIGDIGQIASAKALLEKL